MRKLNIVWPVGTDRYIATAVLDQLWAEVYAAAFAADVRTHGDVVVFSTARDRATEQADRAVQQLVDNQYG